jgi:iron complex outermembrane receptor protein
MKFRRILLSTSIVVVSAGTPAFSQERQLASAGNTLSLETIVVTAQKREESLQVVPLSVNAVTAEAIADSGATTIEHLALVVPGVNLTRQSAATLIYVRGIGTPGGQAGLDAAVSTFVDGVLQPSMAGATMMFNNIERVEVLKGPQGTLYGRNATGGAINIVTRTPGPDGTGEFEVGYSNYDTLSSNAYLSGALTDKIDADVAFAIRDQRDGFGRNITTGSDANDRKDWGVRSKLVFHPTSSLDLIIAGDYMKGSGSYAMSFRPINNTVTFDGQQGWNRGFYDVKGDVDAEIKTEGWGVSGKAVWNLGWATATSITAYRELDNFQRGDLDMTAIPLAEFPLQEYNDQFTQELQLAGELDNDATWIVGLYFLDGTSGYDPFRIQGQLIQLQAQPLVDAGLLPANVAASLVATSHQAEMNTKAYAVFAQSTYPVLSNTNLTLGVRYTRDERDLSAYGGLVNSAGNVLVPIYADSVTGGRYTSSTTFEEPTWRIALDHQITKDIMGYASYSRGFKSGVYNLTAPTDSSVNPEILDAYELGLKSESFSNRLRLNVAAFYYDYSDIQVTIIQGAAQTLLNAAKAEIKGIDFDFVAALTDRLSLSGGAAYVDGTYKEFVAAPISSSNAPFPGVTTMPGDASGNDIVRTPKYTFNLAADYRQRTFIGELGVNLTYSWQDKLYYEPDLALQEGARRLLNAQISLANINDTNWSIKFWGRNITGEEYLSQGTTNFLGYLGAAGEPATYGFSVGCKY